MRWTESPASVRPMLATPSEAPLVQPGWVYEPKYDGIRALVDLRAGGVAIYSRNGNDKTSQFPAIAASLETLAKKVKRPLLLDGEIVSIDAHGAPLGFQHVQGRIHLSASSDIARAEASNPAAVIFFDILRDGDEDVRGLPLAERRLRLQSILKPAKDPMARVRISDIATDDGRDLMARAKREGWEGLIAKDGHSLYYSDRRTPAWRKIKLLNTEEFVIGGWTEPRQTRQHFGALLLGYYDDGQLRFAGSVGTGFDQKELARVAALLAAREISASPFADKVRPPEQPHWVKPDLVAEVRFTEWTGDRQLRQPVYLGIRDDKSAKDVAFPQAKRKVPISAPAAVGSAPRAGKRPVRAASPQSKTKTPTALSASSLADLINELTSLEKAKKDADVALPNGDRLRFTNLAKMFWPKLGITKGELIRYYVEASPFLLPAVDDRPLVMKRFPNGVEKQAFYQQRHPEATPPGVRRVVLPEDIEPISEEGPRDRLVGGSLTTLLYMTQLAAISQDPWFSRVADPMHADYVALDLDPGDAATFKTVLDVARWIKDELDQLEIPAVPKTSGSSGLHIYIPLPKRTTYETGQLLCQVIATIVATAHPRAATVERMVKRRPRGTVYVDYLQNILGKTIATAYSARASDYAGVSTPLTWPEVAKGIDPKDFTVRTAIERFRRVGDLFAAVRKGPVLDLRKVLKKVSV